MSDATPRWTRREKLLLNVADSAIRKCNREGLPVLSQDKRVILAYLKTLEGWEAEGTWLRMLVKSKGYSIGNLEFRAKRSGLDAPPAPKEEDRPAPVEQRTLVPALGRCCGQRSFWAKWLNGPDGASDEDVAEWAVTVDFHWRRRFGRGLAPCAFRWLVAAGARREEPGCAALAIGERMDPGWLERVAAAVLG